jgi:hypothetical protein
MNMTSVLSIPFAHKMLMAIDVAHSFVQSDLKIWMTLPSPRKVPARMNQ